MKCKTKYCRGIASTKCRHLKCPKCRSRLFKIKHPEAYTFNLLKISAKKRSVPISLTLEEFKHWCKETNYIKFKGRFKHSLTIGRLDHDKGYTLQNIFLQTNIENSHEGHSSPHRETKQNSIGIYELPTNPNEPF